MNGKTEEAMDERPSVFLSGELLPRECFKGTYSHDDFFEGAAGMVLTRNIVDARVFLQGKGHSSAHKRKAEELGLQIITQQYLTDKGITPLTFRLNGKANESQSTEEVLAQWNAGEIQERFSTLLGTIAGNWKFPSMDEITIQDNCPITDKLIQPVTLEEYSYTVAQILCAMSVLSIEYWFKTRLWE